MYFKKAAKALTKPFCGVKGQSKNKIKKKNISKKSQEENVVDHKFIKILFNHLVKNQHYSKKETFFDGQKEAIQN